MSAGVRLRDAGEAMEVILPLGAMFALWVVVIWGSNHFNKNGV
jgi:hypothetical protein